MKNILNQIYKIRPPISNIAGNFTFYYNTPYKLRCFLNMKYNYKIFKIYNVHTISIFGEKPRRVGLIYTMYKMKRRFGGDAAHHPQGIDDQLTDT